MYTSRQAPQGRPCRASSSRGGNASAAGQMTTAPSAQSGLEVRGSAMVIISYLAPVPQPRTCQEIEVIIELSSFPFVLEEFSPLVS